MEGIIFHQDSYSFIRIVNNKSEFCVCVEVILNAFYFFNQKRGFIIPANFENHPICQPYQPSFAPISPPQFFLMWSYFWIRKPSADWDVIGMEKMLLTLWITVKSTKLWQHWLTWQWVQQYIYHLWLCCRKSNKRQTIPFRAVTGSLWLTVHALEISAFKLYPCRWLGHWLKATALL